MSDRKTIDGDGYAYIPVYRDRRRGRPAGPWRPIPMAAPAFTAERARVAYARDVLPGREFGVLTVSLAFATVSPASSAACPRPSAVRDTAVRTANVPPDAVPLPFAPR